MAKGKMLGEADLSTIVSREIALAESSRKLRVTNQTKALEYVQGVMKDLPAETGRSKAVSRDVADTIGAMLPGIMRVFTASEQTAVCEPVGSEDIALAKNASDGLNYIFWKENDGYRIMYDATWDSLLNGNGMVQTWHDDTVQWEVNFHSGLSDDDKQKLEDDAEVEILNETPSVEVIEDPLSGEKIEVTSWRLKTRRKKSGGRGRTRIEAFAPEDYGKNDESKTCDAARFQYRRSDKTRSELLEMGFDAKKVEALERSSSIYTPERAAREQNGTQENSDASTDIIDFYDVYLEVDVDGDGIAETCHISYAGSKDGGSVLNWEEWEDETPFDDIPCNPMPHRWEASSIADETIDIQQIKTVLLRQALDNTYATLNPQRFVTGEISNPDELFSPSFGGAIFGKTGSTVTNLEIPFVASAAYDGLNYQDQVKQSRTGIARQTMALDPDALQNQTATANQNERDASYSQIEIIARNQAELGWKKVFRKALRLEIKHQDKPRQIRMKGKPVTVDPRSWNVDMDISINVGLGSGSRDRDMMFLREIKQDQMMLTAAMKDNGFAEKALDMVPYILNTLNQSAEAAGIKSPELFFPEVTPEEIETGKAKIAEMAQQPSPDLVLEQERGKTQIQVAQAQTAADAQLKQAEMAMTAQTNEQASQAAVTREAAQLEADMRTKDADRQNALIIERQKQDFEREKLASTERLAIQKMAEDARQKDLDRQQAWNIEMARIASSERAAGRAAQAKAEEPEQAEPAEA